MSATPQSIANGPWPNAQQVGHLRHRVKIPGQAWFHKALSFLAQTRSARDPYCLFIYITPTFYSELHRARWGNDFVFLD